MIIYFSGTGNSRFLAKTVARELNDEAADCTDLIKSSRAGSFSSAKPYVFVCPTYAWQIPHIFEKLIRDSSFSGSRQAYFIMSCGSEIGFAERTIKALCKAKGFCFCGVMPVVMPENYIALFSAPDEAEASALIAGGEAAAKRAAGYIREGSDFPPVKATWADRRRSGIINKLFYGFVISDKKFYATEKCISCGKCEQVCPLCNVSAAGGKPVWGGNCTHCMACISCCPAAAIEYGAHTKGLRRYYLK